MKLGLCLWGRCPPSFFTNGSLGSKFLRVQRCVTPLHASVTRCPGHLSAPSRFGTCKHPNQGFPESLQGFRWPEHSYMCVRGQPPKCRSVMTAKNTVSTKHVQAPHAGVNSVCKYLDFTTKYLKHAKSIAGGHSQYPPAGRRLPVRRSPPPPREPLPCQAPLSPPRSQGRGLSPALLRDRS